MGNRRTCVNIICTHGDKYMYKACSYMYAGSSENFGSSKVAMLVEL